MDSNIQAYFDQLNSKEPEDQYEAFNQMMSATNQVVTWAYDVWDELKTDLTHSSNHKRARAAQFLAGLAKSDPEQRMLEDFKDVWNVTYDPKFVTARHTLQSIWKVGVAGALQKALVLEHLTERFIHCTEEKNCTLIRYDIQEALRKLYEAEVTPDEILKERALALIELEEDMKYRKKYLRVWEKRTH